MICKTCRGRYGVYPTVVRSGMVVPIVDEEKKRKADESYAKSFKSNRRGECGCRYE